MWYQLSCFVD